tara:strand:+ start:89 stop:976 length:888 start_codon:yes stop_codon:yes gene_type:complete
MSQTVNDEYPGKKITDEKLKELAVQQFEEKKSEQSTTYNFPTEVVELPSKGLLYPKDNPLATGRVEMKYMTAREEDILTTPSLIKQGIVLDKLFRALIVGNGEGTKINYADLLSGDKNAIMIAARVLGYGKDYEIEVTAPSGNKQTETIDLSKLDNKSFDESKITPGQNKFSLTLPHSKRLIEFKILTHRDERELESKQKSNKKYNKTRGFDGNVTSRLAHLLISVDGNDDPQHIKNFVENEFLARDVQALREYLTKVSPDVDLNFTFVDEETGEDFEAAMPIGIDFFWPSVDLS